MGMFEYLFVILAAAVCGVALSKKTGLGSILGYLLAGLAVGPWGLALIAAVESITHVAELGVVLLMFLIGLDLQPSRLWQMRHHIFGAGGVQLLVTPLVLGLGLWLCLDWPPAALMVAAFGLSLSSTALVMQLLAEQNELASRYGRLAFALLLAQDLAVIGGLATLQLLGTESDRDPVPLGQRALGLAAVGVGLVLGRLLLRHLFHLVARLKSHDLFTATALLVVVATALGVERLGLSMALGAFLAGVLLADSEFRHELEANLEPFKGLLLGLFFMAVGMRVNLGTLRDGWPLILSLTAGLLLLKGAVMGGIGRVVLGEPRSAWRLAALTAQGGEFAFVFLNLAVAEQRLTTTHADILVLVVGLSMAATPVLWRLQETLLQPRLRPGAGTAPRAFDTDLPEDSAVIVAGFGRVGQIVGRILRAKHIPYTALDTDAAHIEFIKKFGARIFYGDASRLEMLRAAGAERAQIFVLAIDAEEASIRCAITVRKHFPNLQILARAHNRSHAYKLMNLGIEHVTRETFEGSIEMAGGVLTGPGPALLRVQHHPAAFSPARCRPGGAGSAAHQRSDQTGGALARGSSRVGEPVPAGRRPGGQALSSAD